MKRLTSVQNDLLTQIKQHISKDDPMGYDELKMAVDFKSFDGSFNALVNKGYVERHKTNDFSNQFKLTENRNNKMKHIKEYDEWLVEKIYDKKNTAAYSENEILESISLNEEIYDLLRDLRGEFGSSASVDDVEQYLGGELNSYEERELKSAGFLHGHSSGKAEKVVGTYPSSNGKTTYTVTKNRGRYKCECPAYQYSKGRKDCKHIKMAKKENRYK